jgi:NAD(P)-dependent dehydrogenase (short-subunit alcohol dehydrogenase family)
MDLDGATALVTGGAAGIGAGIADRLAAEGMHVVIADLDEQTGRETAARIGGSFVRADITTDEGVHTAVDTAARLPGRVGVLVTTPEASRARASPRPTRPDGSSPST